MNNNRLNADQLKLALGKALLAHDFKVFATGLGIGMLATLFLMMSQISDAKDEGMRIKEQYRDCIMIGDFPTTADIPRE